MTIEPNNALRQWFESWCKRRWAGDRRALTLRPDGEYEMGSVEFG